MVDSNSPALPSKFSSKSQPETESGDYICSLLHQPHPSRRLCHVGVYIVAILIITNNVSTILAASAGLVSSVCMGEGTGTSPSSFIVAKLIVFLLTVDDGNLDFQPLLLSLGVLL